MGKKINTLIFMVVATLVNVLLLGIFVVLGLMLVAFLMNRFPSLQESSMAIPLMLLAVFIIATVLAFLIYNKLVKWVNKKFNLEDKLHPIFAPRKKG